MGCIGLALLLVVQFSEVMEAEKLEPVCAVNPGFRTMLLLALTVKLPPFFTMYSLGM
jgi:hypothetical protein